MESIVHQLLSQDSSSTDSSNSVRINQTFLENVEAQLSLETFNQQLLSCSTKGTLHRILMISKYFSWIPIEPETLSKYRKNPEFSSKLREAANEYFKGKNYEKALECYNLAILFSPPKIEQLALALANRSATLLAMGREEDALRDVDLALENNYPEKLKPKLSERRRKCEEGLLAKRNKEEESEEEIKGKAEKEKRRRFCDGILFRVKKPNPLLPSAEEFVQVRYDPTRGRQLAVNRDIPAGTVLIVEKPYVSVLKDLIKWDVRHCHYCLKKISRGVPCPGCVFALYCDDSCLVKAAEEFHNTECPLLPYLHCNETPRYILLALRIICKLGPQKLYSLSKDESLGSTLGSEEKDSSYYSEESYAPIHNLVSHPTQMELIDLYTNTLNAIIVTTILDVQSPFFNGIPETEKPEFFNFVASLMLHHIENVPCNSISLDELQGLENVTLTEGNKDRLATLIRGIQFPQLGAGVYKVASLMNHSCDPNVTRVNGLSGGTLAVVATRAMRANEEIVTCYSRSFINDDRETRQDYLSSNYFFDCDCIACRQEWPTLQGIMKRSKPEFCCGSCSVKFSHEEKEESSLGFKKCVLRKGKCRACGRLYLEEEELFQEFNRNVDLFFGAYKLVLGNAPLEGIKCLMPALKYFHSNVCPPYGKAYMGQDVYKQALELLVYFS